jgi:hypothetical protein
VHSLKNVESKNICPDNIKSGNIFNKQITVAPLKFGQKDNSEFDNILNN